jgi:hypothetical protein
MSSDATAPPFCPDCSEPMKLVTTLLHLGGLPEIFVFYCSRCKQAETMNDSPFFSVPCIHSLTTGAPPPTQVPSVHRH